MKIVKPTVAQEDLQKAFLLFVNKTIELNKLSEINVNFALITNLGKGNSCDIKKTKRNILYKHSQTHHIEIWMLS